MLDTINGKLDYEVSGDCDYIGLNSESIITEVNNDDRTIYASLNFDALPKLPNGKFKDGSYVLQAEVSNGQIRISWSDKGMNLTPCYYGNIVIKKPEISVNDIDAHIIKSVCAIDDAKIDKSTGKTYTYSETKMGRCLFAYPEVYGDLADIIFVKTGWSMLSTFTKMSLEIDDVPYIVYIQKSYATGEFTYSYKFED